MNLEGITVRRVYYVVGVKRTSLASQVVYEAANPPNAGYSRAFVIEPPKPKKEGGKPGKLTLFCPSTLTANQVSPECGELQRAEIETLDDERLARLGAIIVDRWKVFCSSGQPRDYDVAAMVLQRLGIPVPTERPETDSTTSAVEHGKPALGELLKPVTRTSKRGKIAEFFMAAEGLSMLEAMAKFGSSRAVILTHLYGLHADHGLGYKILGDTVTVHPPGGMDAGAVFGQSASAGNAGRFKKKQRETEARLAEKPASPAVAKFKARQGEALVGKIKRAGGAAKTAATKKTTGKPCAAEVTPLPAKGKRRDIAISCSEGWVPVEELATRHGCSTGSVKSHLADLHTKHGFGYEQDDNRVRLITPKGWTA